MDRMGRSNAATRETYSEGGGGGARCPVLEPYAAVPRAQSAQQHSTAQSAFVMTLVPAYGGANTNVACSQTLNTIVTLTRTGRLQHGTSVHHGHTPQQCRERAAWPCSETWQSCAAQVQPSTSTGCNHYEKVIPATAAAGKRRAVSGWQGCRARVHTKPMCVHKYLMIYS